MKTWEAAIEILHETKNPAVMWGDEGLLHLIADRAKLKTCGRSFRTSDAVLTNLSKCPGDLIAGYTTVGKGRRVRIFQLKDC